MSEINLKLSEFGKWFRDNQEYVYVGIVILAYFLREKMGYKEIPMSFVYGGLIILVLLYTFFRDYKRMYYSTHIVAPGMSESFSRIERCGDFDIFDLGGINFKGFKKGINGTFIVPRGLYRNYGAYPVAPVKYTIKYDIQKIDPEIRNFLENRGYHPPYKFAIERVELPKTQGFESSAYIDKLNLFNAYMQQVVEGKDKLVTQEANRAGNIATHFQPGFMKKIFKGSEDE